MRDPPLSLGSTTFVVVRHYKQLAGKNNPDARALASIDIVDVRGMVQYHETFPYRIEGDAFSESCSADVQRLEGSNGNGLLLDTGCEPSAPLAGGPWEILGLVEDRLVRIGKPLVAEGQLGAFTPGQITKVGQATQILPDVLTIRVWTGYFFAAVPVRIDWHGRMLSRGQRCYYQTGHGFEEEGCEVPADGFERHDRGSDLTFVRLFPESRDRGVAPAHVVVKPDSSVDILAAKAFISWSDQQDTIALDTGDDVWVKVRIDGKEGWIHTTEDLSALGLEMSG